MWPCATLVPQKLVRTQAISSAAKIEAESRKPTDCDTGVTAMHRGAMRGAVLTMRLYRHLGIGLALSAGGPTSTTTLTDPPLF